MVLIGEIPVLAVWLAWHHDTICSRQLKRSGPPMGFAISLRSDNPSAQSVRKLWKQVERFEDKPSMAELAYPPHITLAIYDDPSVSATTMREVVKEASSNVNALSLTFDAIRYFDGPSIVLWASPQINDSLLSLHGNIHELVGSQICRPYYRPGAWKPHCTLATRIKAEEREAALSFASEFRDSFDVTFDGLDCISFPPLTPVELRRLPSARGHTAPAYISSDI